MSEFIPQEVITAFEQYTPGLPAHSAGKITVEPVGQGLIHRTYKISSELKTSFLLQQINQSVFPSPEDVQENLILLTQYAEYEFTGLRLAWPRYYSQQDSLYKDENGNYWRAFEFIEDSFSANVAKSPAQARAVAKAFAKFTAAFEELNTDQLKIVIPGFHDLSFRYGQFEEALQGEYYERMPKALPLADELKQRERYRHFYEIITESPDDFPVRVMHHDAKISNVLFRKKNGKLICVVDLDTAMPGYFFSDIGDMIRSMSCSLDENSPDFNKLKIRKSYYEAITGGYLSVMNKFFTGAEKKYIHYAGLILIFMQALRFLTDYLDGDRYYQITYPEQNFDRAKNQLTLLKRLEEFLEKESLVSG
jgi:hypothetical protein